MQKERYALIIGGTGMLAQVCHGLVDDYYYVSVVGRRTIRHQQLKDGSEKPGDIHSVLVDYQDNQQFRFSLREAFHTCGIPDLVVSWIHGSAPHALDSLIDEIAKVNNTKVWKLFQIQGSSRFFEKENTSVPENCQYRRVYLGFILEGSTSRWLTHNEISSGVLHAIQTDQQETIVGTLEPWDSRPS